MTDDVLPLLRNFLVQRYGHLKRRLTRALGNDDLADDALHDTWLRLQRGEPPGPVRNPQAYVMRMAVNFALETRRSQSQVLSSDEVEMLLELQPDPAPGPAQVAEDRSQLQALEEILAQMPPRRREILVLVRWEGWPQQDVAERLGVTLRHVEYELKAAQDFCAVRLARRGGPVR
ncbi:sigma-70 family RNA polymerase sigma factor [Pigmentiphaga soli]|uniref:Sigma-70 family RNA polymerase sigma factor n=1 Tax=Pigmentiphaga soli TaxID=1007095 RepID=A0ABP8HI97_9BURK